MKETSADVAAIAAKGMTTALSRAEQKAVCASALAQREIGASVARVKKRINALHRNIQTPTVATSTQVKLLADLKKIADILFPRKP